MHKTALLWRTVFAISSLVLVYAAWRYLHHLPLLPTVCRPDRDSTDDPTPSPLIIQKDPNTVYDPSSKDGDQSWSQYRAIKEVESTLLFYSPSKHPLVVAKDISYGRYYAQRDAQGWNLAYTNLSFEFAEQSFRTQVKMADLSVFLCLGIQSQDRHCLRPSIFQTLSRVQKYNQIFGIRDILWRKDGFCYTMREALFAYKGDKSFVFPCWVLPRDRSSLEKEMNKTLSSWIVKPSGQGEGHGIFVVNYFDEIRRRHLVIDNFVVQPLLANPYLVEGKKFDFRTYVLVTSVLPLRAYIYKEGLVRFASSKYNPNATKGGSERQYLTNTSVGKKYVHLSNLTWTFQKLKDYFTGEGIDSEDVFDRINDAIVRTLLAAEYRLQRKYFLSLDGYDCHSCFQLLGVDVILDSSLHPYVIEVGKGSAIPWINAMPASDPQHAYYITGTSRI